jgi:hypothetical protein
LPSAGFYRAEEEFNGNYAAHISQSLNIPAIVFYRASFDQE